MNVPTPPAPPVPSVRKSRMHADDRHRQLLRSAIDCVARNGFGGTKTKDIAAAAGVSEAILFRHFATKEDLYHAILDMKEGQPAAKGPNRLLQQMEECAARRDDAGVFSAIASAIFGSFREDPAFHRLMLYAMLEGHVMASLFHKRLGAGFKDFLRRYVVSAAGGRGVSPGRPRSGAGLCGGYGSALRYRQIHFRPEKVRHAR